jgi:hypothetical protein
MLPLVPPVADPVRTTIEPLLPLLAVPDFSVKLPLVPLLPAFAVRTVKAPLLVADPNPVTRDIEPPVTSVLSPELTTTRPPTYVSPLPTPMLILPLVPDVAEPVRSTIAPLLPLVAVPVFNERPPLTPDTPLSAVRTVNAPLLEVLP